MMFNNYEIPKDALLNKSGDVTDDGNYVSPFKDPNKKFGTKMFLFNAFAIMAMKKSLFAFFNF